MDGTLIDFLQTVALTTEIGAIRMKNITAERIALSSTQGDMFLDGRLHGNIRIEAGGEGEVKVKGKSVSGERLFISAYHGDITMESMVSSDECHLQTVVGYLVAKSLKCDASSLTIAENGRVKVERFSGGRIEAHVTKGSIEMTIESLTGNSNISLFSGEINLIIPNNPRFKIVLSAPHVFVDPRLQNSGELKLNPDTNGCEEFSTLGTAKNPSEPVLYVRVERGFLNVAVFEKTSNKNAVTQGSSDYTKTFSE